MVIRNPDSFTSLKMPIIGGPTDGRAESLERLSRIIDQFDFLSYVTDAPIIDGERAALQAYLRYIHKESGEALETTMIGVNEAEIIEAELQGRTAFVTVKFVSEQINVTRDAKGEVVDGDPNQVASITDIWTFARNTRSRDPNWTLVATRSSN